MNRHESSPKATATPNTQANSGLVMNRVSDPELDVALGRNPRAAICVQDINVQCVLQFTSVNAAGCALHRHKCRVIHRLELYFTLSVSSPREEAFNTVMLNKTAVAGRWYSRRKE